MWVRGIFVLLLVAAVFASPSTKKGCPKACRCEASSTVCSSLDSGKFGVEVYSLVIQSNEPIVLKNDIFKKVGLEGLNMLKFENTTITSIEPNAFSEVKSLNSLSFVNCKLPNMEELETSAISQSLQYLVFRKCSVSGFEHLALQELEELEISNCNMTEIPKYAFRNMPKLQFINLSNNLLKAFDAEIFNKLDSLGELVLSFNQITEIPDGIFNNLTDLAALDLSHNPISAVDIKSESNLEVLTLKFCEIKSFTGGKHLQLGNIDLSNNNLEDLPLDTFINMDLLEYVILSHNQFKTLDPKLFYNNPNLLKLYLDNNPLQAIPKFNTTNGRFQMFYFSCNSCMLDDIQNDAFDNMPGIITLSLSNNNLKTINANAFNKLKSLIELDLSYNKITELPEKVFSNNTQLATLGLAGNALKELDTRMFAEVNSLKTLDVSNNALNRLWKQPANKLSELRALNTANNMNITSIALADMKIMPNVQALDISGIKLACTSEIKSAFKWLTKHKVLPSVSAARTHEELNAAMSKGIDEDYWTLQFVKYCPDDNDDYDDDEDEDADDQDEELADTKIEAEISKNEIIQDIDETEDEDEDEDGDDDDEENDDSISLRDDISLLEKTMNLTENDKANLPNYLWPTLVFLGTTVIVLIVCSFIILMCIKKRSSAPSFTLSHVQILPWSSSPTIKKHSGSVYRPLSKEMLILPNPNPKFNSYEQVPMNGAQNA